MSAVPANRPKLVYGFHSVVADLHNMPTTCRTNHDFSFCVASALQINVDDFRVLLFTFVIGHVSLVLWNSCTSVCHRCELLCTQIAWQSFTALYWDRGWFRQSSARASQSGSTCWRPLYREHVPDDLVIIIIFILKIKLGPSYCSNLLSEYKKFDKFICRSISNNVCWQKT